MPGTPREPGTQKCQTGKNQAQELQSLELTR
jgi:hypothetical protein